MENEDNKNENRFERSIKLFGHDAIDKLASSKVIIFGLGGVGGYSAEALARSGVGNIDVVDADKINITNINRQIYALDSTIGQYKTDVAKKRILDINPDVKVCGYNVFYSEETSSMFDFKKYDYIIDAIDSIKSKIELILQAKKANTPIISSMGMGNKINPAMIEVSDIYKTSICPLARVMRHELKRHGIKKLDVVYSKEPPMKHGERIIASSSFVPPCCGLIMASEVIKNLIKNC